jgi:hypothetical protein
MHIKPRRLRLLRGKAFDLQKLSLALNGLAAERVDASTIFGNPFLDERFGPTHSKKLYRRWLVGEILASELEYLRGSIRKSESDALTKHRSVVLASLTLLKEKNLACWCGLRDPCHADVLLELAEMEN